MWSVFVFWAHTHIKHETLVSVKEREIREMDVERVCTHTHTHTHTHTQTHTPSHTHTHKHTHTKTHAH